MLTGNLEYLMSSLPNLSFSNSEEIRFAVKTLFQKYAVEPDRSDDMIAVLSHEASKFISTSQFDKLKGIQLADIHNREFQESGIEVVSEFSKFVFQLKSELKAFRLSRRSEESLVKTNYEILGNIPSNPLDAEAYLLKIQWQRLEALNFGHFSNFSALIVYKLKLEVLQRWWKFDSEVGFKFFQETLNVA
jgi:hypothetical protein